MSFLAGRLAATEGAYFLQRSKQAVDGLSHSPKISTSSPSPSSSSPFDSHAADVLPEVLRHSLPLKSSPSHNPTYLSPPSKWTASSSPSSSSQKPHSPLSFSAAANPLRAFVSMPQITFGPKRWQLSDGDHSVLASTANELRRDTHMQVDPKKLKAATEGLAQIGKAFFIATTIVFGGATLVFVLTASKLQLHNIDDIKTKGKDLLQPRFEMMREQVGPLRHWAEQRSAKWHFKGVEGSNEKPILVRELSKQLGSRTPN